MRRILYIFTISTLLLASACKKKDEADLPPPSPVQVETPATTSTPAPSPENRSAPMPDLGSVERVKVSAQGFGKTASEAVSEALRMAVLQVNGATMASEMVNVSLELDISTPRHDLSVRADDVTKAVYERTGGAVTNFRIVELKEPQDPKGRFSVLIEAEVAKYNAPESSKKLTVVIAPIQFPSSSITIGGTTMSASDVANTLHERVSNALTQTGRFSVLERQMDDVITQELDLIATGQTSSLNDPKLSSALAADVVWAATVSDIGYQRHVRRLNTSSRDLVSYSGGWALNQKLVNVATRQILTSGSLKGAAPSIAPTTLSTGINPDKVLNDMLDDLSNQVVSSIIRSTFPITVISRDGLNVVLSQGGHALREGGRYAVVAMGDELTDPQTGYRLGRTEFPCCEVVVARVTPNLSYGYLEAVKSDLDSLAKGALQVREEIKTAAVAPASQANQPRASNNNRNHAPSAPPPAVKPAAQDDKW